MVEKIVGKKFSCFNEKLRRKLFVKKKFSIKWEIRTGFCRKYNFKAAVKISNESIKISRSYVTTRFEKCSFEKRV